MENCIIVAHRNAAVLQSPFEERGCIRSTLVAWVICLPIANASKPSEMHKMTYYVLVAVGPDILEPAAGAWDGNP